jgi:hypothetical protein
MRNFGWFIVRAVIGYLLLSWLTPEFLVFIESVSVWKTFVIFLIVLFMYDSRWN